MQTKNIHQTVVFENATPHTLYEMLVDSDKHAAFSGAPAHMSRETSAPGTAYDGWVEFVNIELVPDTKIVQKWRGKDWPKDHYSTATFEFAQDGANTTLTFTQTDVPEDQHDHISSGWHAQYWDKMKKALVG